VHIVQQAVFKLLFSIVTSIFLWSTVPGAIDLAHGTLVSAGHGQQCRDEKIIETNEWSVDEMWAFVRM